MTQAGAKRARAHRAPPRATKTQRLGESPVTLRLPVDLVARVDALLPAVARDSDTATLLGGVSRSALLRLVIVEGMRVLELRYHAAAQPTAAPGGGTANTGAQQPRTAAGRARRLAERTG